MKRKFTKYPSSYVRASSESCKSAHWEAIAEFDDGTTLEFTRPVTVSGWQAEDAQQYDVEQDLLRKAVATGKEVVFYTVNFVCDD